MERLTKKDFLRPRTPRTKEVPVEEWGGMVTVQEMTAEQRDEFDEYVIGMREENKVKGLRAVVVSICVVDEEGKRVFNDLDIPDLNKKSATIIGRIADAAMQLSGLSEEDVEERVKNSETGPASDSNSNSVES
jgi:hypothetical protein